jgi:PAS domain S-box-containing protein
LLGGLYDGVLVLDPKGVVIASNHRAEQFLGYSEQELWGMSCEELIVGINARVLHKLHTHAEAGRFTVVNGTCKRKDATSFPSEIAISRIRFFNDGDLIFSIRSIERREKVREQRELEEVAIRSAGAGIVVCSIEGAIEFVNAAFVKLLNLASEQEVIKHMIGDFCTSYEQVNTMMHAPSSQGNWQGTLELVNPKGAKREVMCIAALSQAHRGAASRIVLTVIPLPKSARAFGVDQ